MNGRLRLRACQARRNSTVELWDSGGEPCCCESRRGLSEIKHVDSAAARRAFWVDGPEEETPENQTEIFVPVCVSVFV